MCLQNMAKKNFLALLIQFATSKSEIMDTKDAKRGLSVFDILSANDMGGILRRIKKCKTQIPAKIARGISINQGRLDNFCVSEPGVQY